MSLTFPNRSRSYDEAGKRIRFVGHDGMFQISFSVAADAMTKLGDKLGEAEGNVTNAKVKAALATMGDDVTKFAELLAKAKDGGVQALAGDATEIQSLATDIQAAGKKISDLCS